MDTSESLAYDSYLGGMNPGTHYTNEPGMHPPDGSQGQGAPKMTAQPAVGDVVKHRLSGEIGTVTGAVAHGTNAEPFPTVRWAGQPAAGFTSDQGYSLDSLTNP